MRVASNPIKLLAVLMLVGLVSATITGGSIICGNNIVGCNKAAAATTTTTTITTTTTTTTTTTIPSTTTTTTATTTTTPTGGGGHPSATTSTTTITTTTTGTTLTKFKEILPPTAAEVPTLAQFIPVESRGYLPSQLENSKLLIVLILLFILAFLLIAAFILWYKQPEHLVVEQVARFDRLGRVVKVLTRLFFYALSITLLAAIVYFAEPGNSRFVVITIMFLLLASLVIVAFVLWYKRPEELVTEQAERLGRFSGAARIIGKLFLHLLSILVLATVGYLVFLYGSDAVDTVATFIPFQSKILAVGILLALLAALVLSGFMLFRKQRMQMFGEGMIG